jgi:hypothetical protein
VADVAVRVAQTGPCPVDDAGEAPASPQQVEVLIVAVDERLPSRSSGRRASCGKRNSLSG